MDFRVFEKVETQLLYGQGFFSLLNVWQCIVEMFAEYEYSKIEGQRAVVVNMAKQNIYAFGNEESSYLIYAFNMKAKSLERKRDT